MFGKKVYNSVIGMYFIAGKKLLPKILAVGPKREFNTVIHRVWGCQVKNIRKKNLYLHYLFLSVLRARLKNESKLLKGCGLYQQVIYPFNTRMNFLGLQPKDSSFSNVR